MRTVVVAPTSLTTCSLRRARKRRASPRAPPRHPSRRHVQPSVLRRTAGTYPQTLPDAHPRPLDGSNVGLHDPPPPGGPQAQDRDILLQITVPAEQRGLAARSVVVCHSEPGAWALPAPLYQTTRCPPRGAQFTVGRMPCSALPFCPLLCYAVPACLPCVANACSRPRHGSPFP